MQADTGRCRQTQADANRRPAHALAMGRQTCAHVGPCDGQADAGAHASPCNGQIDAGAQVCPCNGQADAHTHRPLQWAGRRERA